MFEEVAQVGIRLQAVGLGRFHEAVEGCTGIGAPGASGKQPVLPAHGKRPDGVLGQVVVRTELAVLEVSHYPLPLVEGVADSLAKQTLGRGGLNPLIEQGFDL
jgi:hypothetical protein